MATWKKVVVSGSAISQLNNDKNYLVNGTASASLTGSFTGSFAGDGSQLTGVVASSAYNLTQGAGINTFTYNGTSAQTVSVDSGSLAGNGLTTSGGKFVVSASNGTINVGASGISVSESQLRNIPNVALVNSGSIIGSTPVALGQTVTSIAGLTLTGAVVTGSFSGSFTGTTDLPDLVSGNGLTGGPYDGSSTKTFSVQASGSTLTVGSTGVAVNASGITATELNSTVAGNGLAGGGGTALSVNVDDTSIEINTDTLRVKAGGVSNAMLTNSGSILGSTPVALGQTVTTLNGLTLTSTVASGSFSGSFQGDGTGLTGISASSAVSSSYALSASFASTASYVNPLSQSVNISGSLNLALTGSSTFQVEGNNFQQTYISTAGALVLNPGSGGVGMAGVNQYMTVGYIQGQSAGSYLTGSFTGSFKGDGSGLTGVVSSSYAANATSASYAANATSASYAANSTSASYASNATSASYASNATSASYASNATSASYATNANSASYAATAVSASFALTATSASYAQNASSSSYAGIATTASFAQNAILNISSSSGTSSLNLSSDTLAFQGTANQVSVTNMGGTVYFGLPNDVTIPTNLVVNNNLTVLGTASFQNTQNLEVADRFILMASGSNTTGDGGIVIQQGTQGVGELFAWDAGVLRWAVTGSFDAANSSFVPEAFMAAVIEGAASDPTAVVAKLTKKGNIFVAADETIWIYS